MDDPYRLSYEQFCALFGKHAPSANAIGDRYYLESEDLKKFTSAEQRKPYARGLFLGMGGREFVPSPALLTLLAQHSTRKASLPDPKIEWLFMCGRDIFEEGFRSEHREGFVLVQNSHDENLGLGEIIRTPEGLQLRNILDRGNYLRHERVQLAPRTPRKKKGHEHVFKKPKRNTYSVRR